MGRSVRSAVAAALVLGWLVLVVSTGASAAPKGGKRAPAPPFGWTVDGLVVEALHPRTHAVTTAGAGTYAGRLVLRRSAGGVGVVNEVAFEDYLRGVSEMPNAWPGEALKAQAIAARTYALWDLARQVPPTTAPYKAIGADICATPACQAYTGLAKTQAEHGERWAAAVDATEGQVLWWRNGPIVAKYSSSNGGRSVPGGQPYLRAVDDPDDRHSPLHRWRSTISLTDVGRALGLVATPTGVARAGDQIVVTLPAGATTTPTPAQAGPSPAPPPAPTPEPPVPPEIPAAPAEQVPAPTVDTVTVPVVDFRERVNEAVPTPPGGLPKAVPSVRFDVAPAAGAVVLDGRGWGHGIGMSQWGAFGKAARGMKAPDILATYYGGVRPVAAAPELLPEVIRVAVAVDRPVAEVGVTDREPLPGGGLADLAHGKGGKGRPARFRVSTTGGTVLAHAATGTWRVQPLPKGGLRVVPPSDQAEAVAVEKVGTIPARPRAGRPVRLKVRLPHPAVVSAVVTDPSAAAGGTAPVPATGTAVAVAGPRLVDAGEVALDLPPVPVAGTYTVAVTTDRGGGRAATTTVALEVGPASAPRQLAAAAGVAAGGAGAGGLGIAGTVAGLVAVTALTGVSLAAWRTVRRRRQAGDGGGPLH